MFEFAAALQLPSHLGTTQRSTLVTQVLSSLKLQGVEHRRLGPSGGKEGISGGERRRVTVGMDGLLSGCSLMLLDEPTSGLSSVDTHELVSMLRGLCKSLNCTMVVTIHQPSMEVFSMFDSVVCLSKGSCTYNGPADAGSIKDHLLKRIGAHGAMNQSLNMADALVELSWAPAVQDSPTAGL